MSDLPKIPIGDPVHVISMHPCTERCHSGNASVAETGIRCAMTCTSAGTSLPRCIPRIRRHSLKLQCAAGTGGIPGRTRYAMECDHGERFAPKLCIRSESVRQ
jgi:hypothetical protein